ncbi:MAG: hypothetical protein LC110_14450 [Burkholderiales bacterium]|jgi:hypothetical protein|nr:hypothetical protein [Burkholderiales bacterium]OQY73125.1 MAG: hypothetical protein B6D47_04095 [Rhodocyclaceae bacterium UTPRO2]
MRKILGWLFCLLFAFGPAAVPAQETLLKPFVLASKGPGEMTQAVEAAKAKLLQNGFAIAGTYSPYPNATVIAVTSDEMRAAAAKSELGGFGAAQRVAVTKVRDEVQVSYTNPTYMAHAYRMAGDLKGVRAKLQAALGRIEEFGSSGHYPDQLRRYHYMIGMEYFDEPSLLASYASHDEAVRTVEAGLAAGKYGVTKVYRVDVAGKKEVLFGVAMKGEGEEGKFRDDKYIMSVIDFKDVKSTAHLPYDMLVVDNKIYALYAKFRIAINFPDLSMMGENSFMRIQPAPEAIRKALLKTAGGKEE